MTAVTEPIGSVSPCPSWCRQHNADAETGVDRHEAGARSYPADALNPGDVVVVGLEWDPQDSAAPVINLAFANDAYFTPRQAAALGGELLRLAALSAAGSAEPQRIGILPALTDAFDLSIVSRQDLADQLDVPRVTIDATFAGVLEPTARLIALLCRLSGKRFEDLFEVSR